MEKAPTPTRTTYDELQRAYDLFNVELFEGRLPSCLITLQRQKNTYGYFSSQRFGRRDGEITDEIAINPSFFAVVPQVEVLQTLAHEMTHLWQQHFGKPSRACYHNREWADRMESIGLMPSSTGKPGGRRVGQHMADYPLPGGPFEQVTKSLFDSGYQVTWLDRYPAPPLDAGQQNEERDEESVAPMATKPNGGRLALPPQALQRPVTPAGLITAPVLDKSRRVRFTCPICDDHAWGKPSLHLVCGKCEVPFLLR